MENNTSLPDDLIQNQRVLFAQVKISHKLFLFRSIMLFVISLPLLIFFFFYLSEDPDSDSSSIVIFVILPLIFIIKEMKENISFFVWSKQYLKKIEESIESSVVFNGLTTYMNRLYKAAFLDTEIGNSNVDISPSEFMNKVKGKMKFKLILFLIVLCLVIVTFTAFFKEISIGVNESFVFCIIIFLAIILVLFQFQWYRSLGKWAPVFEELDKWGEQLENLYGSFNNNKEEENS